ncbi:hypothetical protein D9M71_523080 [compost metagenome]
MLGLQFVEIVSQALRDNRRRRVQPVQRVAPPAEEKEFPVEQAQGRAGQLLLLGALRVIEEVAGPTLCRRFDGDKAICCHRLEGASDDLPRLVRILGADLPELGNVQIAQRAAPE